MELSKRLKMNVDLVSAGTNVADIGCDHGYVTICLAAEKGCHCIAMDVNEGPLKIAAANIKKNHLESKIDCRLSDGMEKLTPGEADTLLIAGMGGMLVSQILQKNPAVLSQVHTLVLQPQSDWEEVRRLVYQLGFRIEKESCCVDGGKFYLAIRAVRDEKKLKEEKAYSYAEFCYGRYLPEKKDLCYHQYLMKEYEKSKNLVERLKQKKTEHSAARIRELEHTMMTLGEVLVYRPINTCTGYEG
jgi:tRNA (adenine22-N1)-methyltransferase